MDQTLLERFGGKYPFLSVCQYADNEFVGIIQNTNSTITTIYDYGLLHDIELKKLFLELGETWWWESNRSIPINLFLKDDWDIFKPVLRTFTNKTLKITTGPSTSLNDISHTKKKRRSITMVRRPQ